MITNAANKTRKKSFEDELWEYLEIEFGLEQTALPELGTWLHNQVQITAKERAQLDSLSIIFKCSIRRLEQRRGQNPIYCPLAYHCSTINFACETIN